MKKENKTLRSGSITVIFFLPGSKTTETKITGVDALSSDRDSLLIIWDLSMIVPHNSSILRIG